MRRVENDRFEIMVVKHILCSSYRYMCRAVDYHLQFSQPAVFTLVRDADYRCLFPDAGLCVCGHGIDPVGSIHETHFSVAMSTLDRSHIFRNQLLGEDLILVRSPNPTEITHALSSATSPSCEHGQGSMASRLDSNLSKPSATPGIRNGRGLAILAFHGCPCPVHVRIFTIPCYLQG